MEGRTWPTRSTSSFFRQAAEHNQRCLWIHHLQHLWPMFLSPTVPCYTQRAGRNRASCSGNPVLSSNSLNWYPIKRSMYDYVKYGIKLSTAFLGGCTIPHFFVKNVQAHVLTFWLIPQCFQLLSATSRARASQATEVCRGGAYEKNEGL